MFIIVFGSLPALHPLWERLFEFLGASLASGERNSSGRHSGVPGTSKYRRQLSSSDTERAVYHGEARVPDVELVRLTDHPAQPQSFVTAVPGKGNRENWVNIDGFDQGGKIYVHRQVDITSDGGKSEQSFHTR